MEKLTPEEEKSVLFSGRTKFSAAGQEYEVKPLTLEEVIQDRLTQESLFLPFQEDMLGQNQIFNLQDPKRRESLNLLIMQKLTKNGAPTSLETITEDGWDLNDLGKFFLKVMQISG